MRGLTVTAFVNNICILRCGVEGRICLLSVSDTLMIGGTTGIEGHMDMWRHMHGTEDG